MYKLNIAEAIIDAYKLNMLHGKRLNDKQIYAGIKKTLEFLKDGDNDKTYKELCELLNISKSSLYEYQIWIKITKILKCDVDKIKANKLNIFLKNIEEGEENLKLFWELNKNLSVRGVNEAIKYYRKTGKIVDWDKYKAQSVIFSDDEDDGLIEKEKTLTRISDIQQHKETIYLDEVEDEEEFEIDDEDIEEETNPTENILDNNSDNLEDENEEEYVANQFVSNNTPIEEGRKIETGKLKDKKDDHLVSVPGLVRKYSFETVMNNVFEELTEGVISSNNSLNEVLEKHLHDNRQMFENKKEEYLRSLDNVEYILKKMRKTLERANKDFKE